jgi:hypothetical protein
MTKTTTPFRVTLILDGASTVAQVENIERILDDDGGLVASKVLPAETLALPLSEEILGAANAALLAQISELQSQLATAQGQETPSGGVTPLTLIMRIVEMEKWPIFEATLGTLPSYVEKAFYAAATIEESHPLFLAYGSEFKALLDLTDEEFSALLTP